MEKNLKSSIINNEEYVKVKNGVIFYKGKEKKNINDNCVVFLTEDNVPKFTVTEGGVKTVYFLHDFIENGDLYDVENGFRKTTHGFDESEITLYEHFYNECLREMEDIILSEITTIKDYKSFKKYIEESNSILKYMISEIAIYNEAEVDGVKQIEIDENKFETYKKNAITNECKKAANEKALELGANIKNMSIELE